LVFKQEARSEKRVAQEHWHTLPCTSGIVDRRIHSFIQFSAVYVSIVIYLRHSVRLISTITGSAGVEWISKLHNHDDETERTRRTMRAETPSPEQLLG
jgi:hypothetical protein